MATTSELLFDKYCEARGYTSTPVEAGPNRGQTPDRIVSTPSGRIVVEIKELTANPDDRRQARELAETGMTSGGGQPGARVGRLIERAAPQLRQFANLALPSVLVVYDNIVVNGQRPRGGYSIHLESSFIDFGMYGLQTVVCKVVQTPVAPRLVPVSDGRGGERQMTEDERVYISAVAVLQEHHESRDPYLVTYHNYFACRPLPPAALRGGDDRHFEKPSHPNTSPQEWREIL